MASTTPTTSSRRKWLILALKIAVSIACLWYVFSRIDIASVRKALLAASPWWLLGGLACYTLSKFVAAARLNINFRNIGIHLPEGINTRLFWVGMFYNLFLPGAITGDAYKVVLLSKQYKTSYKRTTSAVLLDRFSGLLGLGLILAASSLFALKSTGLIVLLCGGAMLAIPLMRFVISKWFRVFLPGFWPTFTLGVVVQLLVLASVYCILFALNISENTGTYIFIFLLAAVASVLPISVGGGLGVREFVIIEGARYSGLGIEGQHQALLLSLLFYLITLVCSLAGLFFIFNRDFPKQTE